MRMRRAFVCSALLAIGACIAVSVMASQSFPMRPPPEAGLEDWLDVWTAYKLEAIPTRPEPHVVQPGETIWSIAEMYRLPGDLRMTVDILRELNGLWGADGPRLRPGQRLKVPEPDEAEWPVGMKWCWNGRRR
ncbi:MAG: LysM peptidoglycan-binding domain-containing protein [Bacillota bacterium]